MTSKIENVDQQTNDPEIESEEKKIVAKYLEKNTFHTPLDFYALTKEDLPQDQVIRIHTKQSPTLFNKKQTTNLCDIQIMTHKL